MSASNWPFSVSALDGRFTSLLDQVFSEATRAVGISRPLSVNEHSPSHTSGKDPISIYSVDYRVLEDNSVFSEIRNDRSRTRLINLLRVARDAIATLPEGVVVVDSRFLSLLLLLGHNSFLSFSQGVGLQGPDESQKLQGEELGRVQQQAHAMNIADSYLRFGNLSVYWNDRERWYDDEELHKMGASVAEVAARGSFEAKPGSERPTAFYESLWKTFLLPIAVHELGHVVNQVNNTEEVNAESEVDSMAVSAILQRLNSTPEDDGRLFHRQAIIEFATIMRDVVLANVFSGFRGLRAKDVLFYLEEKNPVPERVQNLPFLNPDRLAYGHFNPLPILTESELEGLVQNLKINAYATKHRHLYLRAVELAEAIGARDLARGNDIFFGYHAFLRPFEDISTEDLAALERGSNSVSAIPEGRMSLSIEELLQQIEDSFDLQSGIPAGDIPTWVGFRPESFIEIVGPPESLKRVRYVRRIDQDSDHYVEEVEVMSRLLMNVNPEWAQNPHLLEDIHGEAHGSRTVSVRRHVNDYVISFGRLNNSEILQLSLEPAQSFTERRLNVNLEKHSLGKEEGR